MTGMPTVLAGIPKFEVGLQAPDISRWRSGNTGIRGFLSFDSGVPGPHVVLLALSHGNEIAGAIALDRLLDRNVRPARGKLSFGFTNIEAYARFDPQHPTLSRFIDEDINRVWDPVLLDGLRRSSELDRAREIRPLIDRADVVFDLHSMLWPSDPLTLCGATEKGRRLACAIGTPDLVVSDSGHVGGRRLIDYPRFADPDTPFVANLLEAGQHWQSSTVDLMLRAVAGLLRHYGMLAAPVEGIEPLPPNRARCAEVTVTVTATTAVFSFVQPWRGGEVIKRRNTLIALDGHTEIRTPYDDCLLVMPSLRPSRGHTAVRLAHFV
jgi:predicted deacylase